MGDIVKVTPSSKAVGDLALFMVQNDLDKEGLLERADELTFPDSVISFFEGMMGQPMGGFPEGAPREGAQREGADHVPPGRAAWSRSTLRRVKRSSKRSLAIELSASGRDRARCSTRRCFETSSQHHAEYSDTSVMDTPTFFYGLALGEETRIEMEPGKTLIVKLTAVGELFEGRDAHRLLRAERPAPRGAGSTRAPR